MPVSVAIPVYNGMPYLREAIESVLGQTVAPAELRIFDNASTDGSAAVAAAMLPPGAVVVSDQNLGAVANFNRALLAASQPYFMWLGADDRLAPAFLERALAALEASPSAAACLTAVRFIDGDGVYFYDQVDHELASVDPRTRLRPFLRRRRWTEFYCLYRTEALLGSPRVLPVHGSDVLLTWWLLLRGPFAVIDERLLDYRVAGVKSVEEVTENLAPGSSREHWLKIRMWMALWQMTGDPQVPASTRRVARQELASVLLGTAWWYHLAEDVTLRWPWIRRLIGRFVTLPRVARPREVSGEPRRLRRVLRRRRSR